MVVKVQRPGLKELFDIDLKNVRVLAQWLQAVSGARGSAAGLVLGEGLPLSGGGGLSGLVCALRGWRPRQHRPSVTAQGRHAMTHVLMGHDKSNCRWTPSLMALPATGWPSTTSAPASSTRSVLRGAVVQGWVERGERK